MNKKKIIFNEMIKNDYKFSKFLKVSDNKRLFDDDKDDKEM